MIEVFTVAFFGHRYVTDIIKMEKLLKMHIRKLVERKSYVDFLVGRNGDFDRCVSSSVVNVQKNYRADNSSHILVLPYPTVEFLQNQDNFKDYYTDIEISEAASKAHPKAAIQIRNREMVDRADLIICYVEQRKGGAWQTVQYAIRQNKAIINIAEQ